MCRCLYLATKGLGHTYPNPLVGCVIVKNNKILAEGWHQESGKSHAESNTINAVKNKSDLEGAVLYVNLEPCCHYGKTPPCTDLIISSKIRKVVVGTIDPNPRVNGQGLQTLKKAGIIVQTGVCKQQCEELNKRFFCFINKKRPYILLKWAQSEDGFIDKVRNQKDTKASYAISSNISRLLAHQWRSHEQAIMIGTNTALNDNPRLDVRGWIGKSPARVVLDKKLRIPLSYHLLTSQNRTIIFTEDLPTNKNTSVEYIILNFKNDLIKQVCSHLYNLNIQSLIIEGGKQLLESFIKRGLWDEAFVFRNTSLYIEKGLKAPKIEDPHTYCNEINNDMLFCYKK